MGTAPSGTAPEGRAATGDGLARRLTLLDAIALHVGIILGSGIFVAPDDVAAILPGAWGALLWAAGGAIAACGALVYAECGVRIPRTGGFFNFWRHALGDGPAFVAGWAGYVATYPASMAAIARVFADVLPQALPGVPGLAARPQLVAAGALLATTLLNVAGVRLSASIQRVLSAGKVAAVAAVVLAAVWMTVGPGSGGAAPPVPAPPDPAGAPSGTMFALALAGLVAVLWAYDGWSDVTLVAGEIRDPGRDLGRTVLYGTLVLVALYTAVQLGVVAVLGSERTAASEDAFTLAVQRGLGPRAAVWVAWIVVVSTLGSLHGITLAASRIGYAMARDGAFFRLFHQVHPRFGTPSRAVLALGAASIVYVLATGFRELVFHFSFNVWIFYAATGWVLLRLRRWGTGEPVPWRAPGGILPVLVLWITAAAVTGSLLVQRPRQALLGVSLLAAGIPIYLVWRTVRGRRTGGIA